MLHSFSVLESLFRLSLLPTVCLSFLLAGSQAQVPLPKPVELLISVADQKIAILCEGNVIRKYPVSTSKFGLGDSIGSYKTPLGNLKVCDKVGNDLASGTVIKHRVATHEVLPVNAAGRDPIVTRIIWLDGLDPQNRNAKARSIYIHGTTEESKLGAPVSWGCIRMRSRDVIALFDQTPVGSLVSIIPGKLPKLAKYSPNTSPALLAQSSPTKPSPPPATPPPLSEIASGPSSLSSNHNATKALQGSILYTGLPDSPQRMGFQKKENVRFTSWSTLSLQTSPPQSKSSASH